MTSLLRCGLINDVIELFGLMIDVRIGYDEVSLSSTLKALAVSAFASCTSCMLLHCHALKSRFESDNAVSCSLIDAYSRSGEVKFYRQVFNQLSLPNAICFTSIISALARNGIRMEWEWNVWRHYSCKIDLMGHVGLLHEAEQLLKEASRDRKSAICISMLRSCRIHQNEQVGNRAAATLMNLDPDDPAAWLQASSFYSEIGDFDSATRFREVAVATKIRRDIGHS
ncbi:unnamed protein product [Fraxinus pennsylvanica]|uniref:Pentatricopeptide repeat-containing protein n=1 Tax=Fraxinus pennsylvanica TaxID=56036 RepID=A0AAD1YT92_9LAMI|nr:unnamed protein product [Fraxinus pennsylvanica]